jgi:hypothetical protein
MPFFAETIRFDRKVARPAAELRARSRALLSKHLTRRPTDDPIARFGARFVKDLAWIQGEGLAFFHVWAFANLRQLGAGFELAARHARWLDDPALVPAAEAFEAISSNAKTLILKGARAVNAKRALDASAAFEEMSVAWRRGMEVLVREVGTER